MIALALEKIEPLRMCSGQGDVKNGELCVMQMIDYATTGKTTDFPECVSPVIRRLAIRLNDRIRDDAERRALLWPLLPMMVGTRTTPADDVTRGYLAVDWLVRECLPTWMRLTPSLIATADALAALPAITDRATLDSSRALRQQARDECKTAVAAAAVAAVAAAAADAYAAAYAAVYAAAYADAAADAAAAAAAAAYDASALRATRDAVGLSMVDLIRRMCAVGRGA